MFQFFESIKYQSGKFFNLSYHQARVDRTLTAFSYPRHLDLSSILPLQDRDSQIYKCRVAYNDRDMNCEWLPYESRKIRKLTLVHTQQLEYEYKYCDRSSIDSLSQGVSANSDILICMNGILKDSSYSNLALFKDGKWYTPVHPLLHGTKRQKLLDRGSIFPAEITIDSLRSYQKVSLINAMLDLGEVVVDCKDIITRAHS